MHRRTLLSGAAALLSAPAIAQPAKATTLRFVPQANLTLLDPVFTTATVTSNHGYYVFDTLYSNGPDGLPHPQMAEGHEIADDKRSWRIKLRPGLTFHDGEPVRAADCIASIQRWAVRDPFGQLLAAAVDSYAADGDGTIVVKLKKPFPLLATALGKPDASIPFIMPERLAKAAADKPGDRDGRLRPLPVHRRRVCLRQPGRLREVRQIRVAAREGGLGEPARSRRSIHGSSGT